MIGCVLHSRVICLILWCLSLVARWLIRRRNVIPDHQYTYVLYSSQFAREQTAVAQRWMAATLRGARDWQLMLDTGQDRQAILGVVAKYTPINDIALLERASLPVISADGSVDLANIRSQITWAYERGYITHQPSADTLARRGCSYGLQTPAEPLMRARNRRSGT